MEKINNGKQISTHKAFFCLHYSQTFPLSTMGVIAKWEAWIVLIQSKTSLTRLHIQHRTTTSSDWQNTIIQFFLVYITEHHHNPTFHPSETFDVRKKGAISLCICTMNIRTNVVSTRRMSILPKNTMRMCVDLNWDMMADDFGKKASLT